MFVYLVLFFSLFLTLSANDFQNLSILDTTLTSLSENSILNRVSTVSPSKPEIPGQPALPDQPLGPISPIKPIKSIVALDALELVAENTVGTHLFTEYQLGNYKIVLIINDILKQPADAIVNAANSGCLGGAGIDGVISAAGGQSTTKHDKAGNQGQHITLYDLRVALPEIDDTGDRCPLGDGRITRGGWLQYPHTDSKIGNNKPRERFNYVIHAVGPICSGGITKELKATLSDSYINVLKRVAAFNKNPKDSKYDEFGKMDISDLGKNYKINSLSFPTISTGIFGCSTNETADSVVNAVYNFLKANSGLDIQQINFVFWDPANQNKAKDDYDFYKEAFSKNLKLK